MTRVLCSKNDQMIDAMCRALDKIVALSQRELRARARYELQESERLQRELKKAVELRGSLLATYTARNAA
jgi:hypothetical protein